MSVLGMRTEANKVYPACDPWERADNGALATPLKEPVRPEGSVGMRRAWHKTCERIRVRPEGACG